MTAFQDKLGQMYHEEWYATLCQLIHWARSYNGATIECDEGKKQAAFSWIVSHSAALEKLETEWKFYEVDRRLVEDKCSLQELQLRDAAIGFVVGIRLGQERHELLLSAVRNFPWQDWHEGACQGK